MSDINVPGAADGRPIRPEPRPHRWYTGKTSGFSRPPHHRSTEWTLRDKAW